MAFANYNKLGIATNESKGPDSPSVPLGDDDKIYIVTCEDLCRGFFTTIEQAKSFIACKTASKIKGTYKIVEQELNTECKGSISLFIAK
ncbi:MAG: hypothetical protein Edafosvirus3_3 [Edafosvirus sp.]|uniref:Uncharacterized protein n=1 Tax=Edafosvirus sp. TaxID=2487765 RepID=A0A3G4ZSR4_9VIRU|nr:MAG: hypothetical protein Edafosvirus3_3 [Edafosvirus sp.]